MPFSAFTEAEQEAIDKVLEFQRKFAPPSNHAITDASASEEKEMHIALDGNGVVKIDCAIHPASGGHMTQAMVCAANSSDGCHIIHNHPRQGSLSSADWSVLAAHPRLQMTAVNSEGTTFRGRVLSAVCKLTIPIPFQHYFHVIEDEFEKKISCWFENNNYDLGSFSCNNRWLVGRSIGERLQASGCAVFQCIPKGSNEIALGDPRAKEVEQFLNDRCGAVII